MEGGLFRDVYSHNITTPEHMEGLMNPSIFSEAELAMYQGEQSDIEPTWDKHCVTDSSNAPDMNNCRPVTIASYENIIDDDKGPDEVARLAAVIKNKPGINIAEESAWNCVWRKVVKEDATGVRTDRNRTGLPRDAYKLTKLEVRVILGELYRLKTKYSDAMWFSNVPLAGVLVTYLDEYIAENEAYLRNL